MEIQGGNQTIEILKWVGIAFAAGFIGYFGRHLARRILERTRKGKPQPPPSPDIRLEEARLKLEKKKAKAEAKRIKKAKKD